MNKDYIFIIVTWPEVQTLMSVPGFETNAYLANDDLALDEFGSSAYFVRLSWLEGIDEDISY